MAKEVNLEEYDKTQLKREAESGRRLIKYHHVTSAVLFTEIEPKYTILEPEDNRFVEGMKYSKDNIIYGWWCFPWGPIITIISLIINLSGGENLSHKLANPNAVNKTEKIVDYLGKGILILILLAVLSFIIWDHTKD